MIITWDQVVGRYSSLVALGAGAADVGSHYIVPAQQELESRLAGFFTVPFSTTNMTAQDLVIDMVRVRAAIGKEKDINTFADRLEARIGRLKDGTDFMLVSSSDGSTNPVQANVGGTVWSTTQDFHPTFGHGDFIDFKTDSSQVRGEAEDRGEFF